MTEVEEIIKQAVEVKRRWKRARIEPQGDSGLSWQELLDGKPYPHLRHGNL